MMMGLKKKNRRRSKVLEENRMNRNAGAVPLMANDDGAEIDLDLCLVFGPPY